LYWTMERCFGVSSAEVRSLSHRERVGVRGYDFSEVRIPSPGAARRPLPDGER
jgi:hypothetical protein